MSEVKAVKVRDRPPAKILRGAHAPLVS